MKKLLIIDNNDSFTYNLVQIFEENDCEVFLIEHSKIHKININEFPEIVISPGPGNPSEYKLLFDFLRNNYRRAKILGVCLGHQVIGEFFGGKNQTLSQVHHGERSKINILSNTSLFKGFSNIDSFYAGRYHSWALSKTDFPDCLEITSLDEDGVIMSFRHKVLPIFGVQFHPESYMTNFGEKLLTNWLDI